MHPYPKLAVRDISAALLLVLIWPVSVQAQSVFTVGPDTACDFSSVQDAIDAAADGDRIRLMAGTYPGGYRIWSKALKLIGGHQNCNSSTVTGVSTFNRQGSGLVVDIFYNGAPANPVKQVVLENLVLRGGGGFGFQSGGLLIEGTPGRLGVVLNKVQVINNTRTDPGDHGAGIRILTTRDAPPDSDISLLTIDDDSAIANNTTAGKGGGIYCESTYNTSAQFFLVMIGTGLIFGNEAGSHGGGIAVNGCRGVFLRNGGPAVLLFPTGGIIGNTAGARGGGIYVENGGAVTTLTRPDHSVLILGNQAANGGGMSVTDANSNIALNGTVVINNQANFGGGLDVRNGASLQMSAHLPCQDPIIGGGQIQYLPCSVLADNEAIGGGAVQIAGASSLKLTRTVVRNNEATGTGSTGGGAAVRAGNPAIYTGLPTKIQLQGVLLHDNTGTSLFRATNVIDLKLRHTTVASNNASILFQNAAASGQTTSVRAESSILQGSTWRSDSGSGTISLALDCVIGNATAAGTGADSLAAYSGGINPKYRNLDLPDYRLKPDSPAIDYCDDRHFDSRLDLDYNPRGIAWVGPTPAPAPGGGLGAYDLGAYETPFEPLPVDLFLQPQNYNPFVAAGQSVTFRVRITNANGPHTAFGDTTVTGAFTPGVVTNVQWTCQSVSSGVSCAPAAGNGDVSASISDLRSGADAFVEITAELANPNADGNFQYFFNVTESAFNIDSNPANNDLTLDFTSGIFRDSFECAPDPQSCIPGR